MNETNPRDNFQENNARPFIKKGWLNLKNFNKILFVIIIAAGVYYIAGINDLAIKGYALSDLKEQRNKLATGNNKLELKAMTLSSYGAISEKINNLKMVAVGNVEYLAAGTETVAKK